MFRKVVGPLGKLRGGLLTAARAGTHTGPLVANPMPLTLHNSRQFVGRTPWSARAPPDPLPINAINSDFALTGISP